MTMDDEKFFAWLDGELDSAEAAEVEAEVAADPRLSKLAEQHRALGTRLKAAFDTVVEVPIPDELMAPAELLNSIEDYETQLSAQDMALVDKYTTRACRDVAAGTACNNTGFLQAAMKLNRLEHFTGKLCQLPVVCTAQSKCVVP